MQIGVSGFHYDEDGFWGQVENMDHQLHFPCVILYYSEWDFVLDFLVSPGG